MHHDKNLHFIANKISDTKVALLHCYSNSVLKLPNNIIHTLKVDDDGYIWFYIHQPQQLVNQYEREFPAGLTYFKKGNNYSVKIFGKARLLTEPDEILTNTGISMQELNDSWNHKILVRVKILKADLIDHEKPGPTMLQKLQSFMGGLLPWLKHHSKSFDFSRKQPAPYIG